MGLRRLGRREERVAFLNATQLISQDRSRRTGGTTTVSLEQGLRNAATWACIDVLSDAIARTPFDAVRKTSSGARMPVEPAPPVIADPSGVVQPDVWFSQMAFSVLTDGNAFGQIVAMDGRGWPTQVETLDPFAVGRRRVVDGVAEVEIARQVHQLWPAGDVLHIPGRMVQAGSPWGLSPLEYAAKAIGTSLAAEDFSNKFFTEGGHPSALVYANTPLTAQQAADVKTAIQRATGGGSREPAVLGSDLKWEQIQTDPKDSQFLDLMQFEVLQACRFWRVPPALVYAAVSGQNVTYSNISDADLQYLKHSLDGYLVRFEGALTRILPRPQFVRANRNAILRMDATRRHEVYATRLEHQTMTVDEVRALEDEPPFGGVFAEPGVPVPTSADPAAAPTPTPA
jgi:HK97 family phage portal protein